MAQAKLLSFKLNQSKSNKNEVLFVPVNKRARKIANTHNLRTRITRADLKAWKSTGNYKFGVYTKQADGKLAFASIKV